MVAGREGSKARAAAAVWAEAFHRAGFEQRLAVREASYVIDHGSRPCSIRGRQGWRWCTTGVAGSAVVAVRSKRTGTPLSAGTAIVAGPVTTTRKRASIGAQDQLLRRARPHARCCHDEPGPCLRSSHVGCDFPSDFPCLPSRSGLEYLSREGLALPSANFELETSKFQLKK